MSAGGIAIVVLCVALVAASINSYVKEKREKAAAAQQGSEE